MTGLDANRDATVVALYAGGATQDEIAVVSGGVSRARIGQILNRNGIIGIGRRRSVGPVQVMAACRRPDVASWHDAAMALGGANRRPALRRVVDELGVAPAIERLFRWRRGHLQQAFREGRRVELIEQYRELATRLGRIPTGRDLRPENGVPFWVTFYHHFATIRELREAAGINSKDRREGRLLTHCRSGQHLLAETRTKWGYCGICRKNQDARRKAGL